MAVQRTLSIIKPDAVRKNVIGQILACFEKNQLQIVATKMLHLTVSQAQDFYAIHRDRPFFSDLVRFMSSGPVLIAVLEGEEAVLKNRELMGATDPKKAAPETIRAEFGASLDENAVHGSDSLENANQEIAYFFTPQEIYTR